MIDIENEIFTILASQLREGFFGVYVAGEYVPIPPTFPAVSIVEISNEIYRKSQSTDSMENHNIIVYEVNAYSNKTSGKKAQVKSIMALVDSELIKLGFTRTMLNPVSNMGDPSIFRMVGRWRAIVDKNKTIYRR